ncbi:MAG: GIY-YIG nuclease family protein [candidate division WOR-3 bacterium]|nr:GIY-YIG nuclease family protein [candidate division WOR-3 bacterium]
MAYKIGYFSTLRSERIKDMSYDCYGTYAVVIKNSVDQIILVGRLGQIVFRNGYYIYLGSAKKNIFQRIKRHLSNDKRQFWHIDYLLMGKGIEIREVWIDSKKSECQIARVFLCSGFRYIKEFGSSDCRCPSHLFYSYRGIKNIQSILRKNGFAKLYPDRLIKWT